jgi:large subunit ribosomal protein L22
MDSLPVASARLSHFRVSPRKARLVLNLIRNKQLDRAVQTLQFAPQKSAKATLKLLHSAIANAREKDGVDIDKLWVVGARVDGARVLRRYMPRAHGRASPIRKRSSHITIELGYKF